MNGLVTVVGSINVDRALIVPFIPRPGETVLSPTLRISSGGKGANQAVAAARAGAGVHMIGRVGADDEGQVQLDALRHHGVDVTFVRPTHGLPTGVTHIAVDRAGENCIIAHPGANAALTEADIDDAATAIRSSAVLLLQLEVPLAAVCRAAQIAAEAKVRIVLNASPTAHLPATLLAAADPVLVNEHELKALSHRSPSVCVTRGSAGAHWGEHIARPGAVHVEDTTGAGDAFAGALAAALANGDGRAEALRAAVEAGAIACTWRGARPSSDFTGATHAADNGELAPATS